MLEKIQDFVRSHRIQVIRMTLAAIFILRGIMQLFPWLFIHGITENFVIYPNTQDLVICALGLLFLFIRWKPTIFRFFIIWISATTLVFLIFFFSHIMGENNEYLTTLFWIFSVLTVFTWAYGNGLILTVLYHGLLDYLETKGYITRTKVRKKKKKKRKKRR
jgi:hypothetical protein